MLVIWKLKFLNFIGFYLALSQSKMRPFKGFYN